MALRRAAWLAAAALAILGCSGGPNDGGAQPYGAGTNAKDPTPQAGNSAAGVGGSGCSGGSAGVSGPAGAGGGDEIPACEESSQPALIGACVTLPEPSAGEYVSMIGVVESIERPLTPSCGHRALGFMTEGEADDLQEIVIRDGESTVSIAVRLPTYLPWTTALVNVGDTVSVDYKAELPLDSVGHGVLTLRDETGALLLWVVQAAQGFDSVGIPELTISDEPHGCDAMVPCGTSTRGAIHAFDGTDEVSIDYARWNYVGDLVVLHGDNTKVTIEETCSSTRSFHRVVVVVVRGGGIPPDG